MTTNLWGGRFQGGPNAAMQAFSSSLPVDGRLWPYDIQGSLAHVEMLARVGILPTSEAAHIQIGLEGIATDLENGHLRLEGQADEDIHSFIERVLTERIGAVAGKLHTGRSRNDQVILDVRLYLKDALRAVQHELRELQQALLQQAEAHQETVLPGYTHLQHAQPVLLAHHLLAYVWMLQRDGERLEECYRRADVLPLGAAALAGTTFPVDRFFVAHRLGFGAVSGNSMDTVSDRDPLIESVFVLSLIMLHLSRLAEEWVLWSTEEFSFLELDEAFSTGSSIMPQKKNPDSMELVRGKTGRVLGSLQNLMVMIKGLPLTYNRDLQEDKEPLFDAFDTALACLRIATGAAGTAVFNVDAMRAQAHTAFSTATDIADYLVGQGVPFREAHEVVGRVVRYCMEHHQELRDLSLMEWQTLDGRFEESVMDRVEVDDSVASRTSHGGTALPEVQRQLHELRSLWGAQS